MVSVGINVQIPDELLAVLLTELATAVDDAAVLFAVALAALLVLLPDDDPPPQLIKPALIKPKAPKVPSARRRSLSIVDDWFLCFGVGITFSQRGFCQSLTTVWKMNARGIVKGFSKNYGKIMQAAF